MPWEENSHTFHIQIFSWWNNPLSKSTYLKKKKKSILCIKGKEKDDGGNLDYKVPQYLRRRKYFLSPWQDCDCCRNHSVGTPYAHNTESWGWFFFFFSRDVVVSIDLLKEFLGNFLTNCNHFYKPSYQGVYHSSSPSFNICKCPECTRCYTAVKHPLSAAVWN